MNIENVVHFLFGDIVIINTSRILLNIFAGLVLKNFTTYFIINGPETWGLTDNHEQSLKNDETHSLSW